MLELRKGFDILAEVGDLKTIDAAMTLIKKTLNDENYKKLALIKNEEALIKIANAIMMCEPDNVFIDSGSTDDVQWIRDYSIKKGEEKKLAKEGHTIHYDLPQDQARLVRQTYYIVNEDEKVSALAKSIPRQEALEYMQKYMRGIMNGMTMIVGFFGRGPTGAVATIPAIEISSSGYVLHSAELLYRNIYTKFDQEVVRKGFFFTNVHSEGPNTPEDVPNARIFMDRCWQTTFSTFCTYAGNTLLMKKGNHRFAVDYATYYERGKELSEHMFITGMTGPDGRKTYFAGAAPSGCGKTTTAMVGTDFIGDDLAQIWIAEDGTVRAVNPEQGIFGIVADVNRAGDPLLMKCLRGAGTEVIWSNVLIDDQLVPHWEGNGEQHPDKGINFQGSWFKGKQDTNGQDIPISHKNARCTLLCAAIDNHNAEANADPAGVPIKVITYSGRDADTMPPILVAKSADAGVAIGASIVSQATAMEVGTTGVQRQPWANAPFIPGALSDYMDAQFKFFNSDKLSKVGRPIMAGLNYFLTHQNRGGDSRDLLGEKRDVKVWLGWLELFAQGDLEAIETAIGYIPKYEDLKKLFTGIDKEYPKSLYDKQFAFYIDKIINRIDLQTNAYSKEDNLPPQLFKVYKEWKTALQALKEEYGSIVGPEQLIEAAG